MEFTIFTFFVCRNTFHDASEDDEDNARKSCRHHRYFSLIWQKKKRPTSGEKTWLLRGFQRQAQIWKIQENVYFHNSSGEKNKLIMVVRVLQTRNSVKTMFSFRYGIFVSDNHFVLLPSSNVLEKWNEVRLAILQNKKGMEGIDNLTCQAKLSGGKTPAQWKFVCCDYIRPSSQTAPMNVYHSSRLITKWCCVTSCRF